MSKMLSKSFVYLWWGMGVSLMGCDGGSRSAVETQIFAVTASSDVELEDKAKPIIDFPKLNNVLFIEDGGSETPVTLRWSEIAGAVDYVLNLNGSFLPFSEISSVSLEDATQNGIVEVSVSLAERSHSVVVIAKYGEESGSAWSESVRFHVVARRDTADYAPVFTDVTRDEDPAKFHFTWASLPGSDPVPGGLELWYYWPSKGTNRWTIKEGLTLTQGMIDLGEALPVEDNVYFWVRGTNQAGRTGAAILFIVPPYKPKLSGPISEEITAKNALNGMCSGRGVPTWHVVPQDDNLVFADIDTSACEFSGVPVYFASLTGGQFHDFVEGATTIVQPTIRGFRLYLRLDRAAVGTTSSMIELAQKWQVQWEATSPGRNIFFDRCVGQHQPTWTQYVSSKGKTSSIMILGDVVVDQDCDLPEAPHYFAALTTPVNQHITVRGANAIYFPTSTGFRVYLNHPEGLSAQVANAQEWGVNWIGTDQRENLTHCVGDTRASDVVWGAVESGGLGASLTVDTSSCGFSHVVGTPKPMYFTSLGADRGVHTIALGTASVFGATKEQFVVDLHDFRVRDPRTTPELANERGWYVNWRTIPNQGEERWLEARTAQAMSQGNWAGVSGSEYSEEVAMFAFGEASAEYTFRVAESGEYAVWGRYQRSASASGYTVQVNSNTEVVWEPAFTDSTVSWSKIGTFFLREGANTFTVVRPGSADKVGFSLDHFLISNREARVPKGHGTRGENVRRAFVAPKIQDNTSDSTTYQLDAVTVRMRTRWIRHQGAGGAFTIDGTAIQLPAATTWQWTALPPNQEFATTVVVLPSSSAVPTMQFGPLLATDGSFSTSCEFDPLSSQCRTYEPAMCVAGLTTCESGCLEVQSDAEHCGGCDGPACSTDQVCSRGMCCPTGEIRCGDTCHDLNSDDQNCGGCGISCASDENCQAGECIQNVCLGEGGREILPGEETRIGANCGRCGNYIEDCSEDGEWQRRSHCEEKQNAACARGQLTNAGCANPTQRGICAGSCDRATTCDECAPDATAYKTATHDERCRKDYHTANYLLDTDLYVSSRKQIKKYFRWCVPNCGKELLSCRPGAANIPQSKRCPTGYKPIGDPICHSKCCRNCKGTLNTCKPKRLTTDRNRPIPPYDKPNAVYCRLE